MSLVETLPVEEFMPLTGSLPLFDVRSPAEFHRGHIPGAVNLPLFSDEERAVIGKTYKAEGKAAAVMIGLEHVAPKMTGFVRAVQAHSDADHLLMHCWRGGMRSESMAWLMTRLGYRVSVLAGGYKAFRHYALGCYEQPFHLAVLSGYTGSGKTHILAELAGLGEQVIDLEGLAHHKGSAFGALGEAAQPTQQQFENRVAMAIAGCDPRRRIWLEDESRRVGACTIVPALWSAMREARVYFIDVPRELRCDFLAAEYGRYPASELQEAIRRLERRLGSGHMKQALDFLAAGDLVACSRILLEHYYDKTYRYGLSRREAGSIVKIATTTIDPAQNAARLLAAARQSADELSTSSR